MDFHFGTKNRDHTLNLNLKRNWTIDRLPPENWRWFNLLAYVHVLSFVQICLGTWAQPQPKCRCGNMHLLRKPKMWTDWNLPQWLVLVPCETYVRYLRLHQSQWNGSWVWLQSSSLAHLSLGEHFWHFRLNIIWYDYIVIIYIYIYIYMSRDPHTPSQMVPPPPVAGEGGFSQQPSRLLLEEWFLGRQCGSRQRSKDGPWRLRKHEQT